MVRRTRVNAQYHAGRIHDLVGEFPVPVQVAVQAAAAPVQAAVDVGTIAVNTLFTLAVAATYFGTTFFLQWLDPYGVSRLQQPGFDDD